MSQPENQTQSPLRHAMTMVILCLCGGTIFNVAYVFEVYYIPTQEAMDLSKSQMGMLMGVFGAFSLLGYGPGGWLADRVSSRKLISLAMLLCGVTGYWYATFPSYQVALALHAFWGITIALVFWNAMIRATRNWAPSNRQGRAFGFLEAGRGLAGSIPASILLALFAWMGSTSEALAMVIMSLSTIIVLCGIAAWFVLEDDNPGIGTSTDAPKKKVGLHEVLMVLKMPAVWLIAMVIIATNSAFWATYYFTPYATEVFMLSVAAAGLLSVGRLWVNPFAPFITGFIADRFGISRTVFAFMLVIVISFGIFAFTPGNISLLPLVILNVGVAAFAIFALRGIYFALLDEQGIPKAVTGTAAGAASVIGFTPDIFMPILVGVLLDTYSGLTGYKILFGGVVVVATGGLLAAWLLMRTGTGRKTL